MNKSFEEILDAALYDGDIEKLDALIAGGMGVNRSFGTDKWNLLHLALVSLTDLPNPSIVKHLIGLGTDVNARDWRLWTPLHFAVRTGNGEVVKMLIEAGAEVDLPNDEGITPLHLCLLKLSFNLEVIEMLLEAGANPDSNHGAGTVRNYVKAISAPHTGRVVQLLDKYRRV
jgi:ankyrin repeat protein